MTDPDDAADARDRAVRASLARHAAAVERRVEAEPGLPADVLARVDRALASERAGRSTTGTVGATTRSRRPTWARATALVAAGVAVLVVLAGVVGLVSLVGTAAPPDGPPPPVAAPDTGGSGPDAGGPEVRPALARGDGAGALAAGLGRADYGPLAAPDRLEECLAAHDVSRGVGPVGGREVVVDGRPAVVLVLTTGVAARFRVLVVEPGCRTGAPSALTDTAVGR